MKLRVYRFNVGLRLRLILVLVIPLALVVGTHGLMRVRQEEAQLLDEDRRNVALLAKAIQIAVENSLRDRKISDMKRLLAAMVEQQHQIDRIRLIDRELRPVLASNALTVGAEIPNVARSVIETGVPRGFHQRRGRQLILYYVAPLRIETGNVWGAIELVHLAATIDQRVRAATIDVWLRLGLLMVVGAGLSAIMLQRQVLRPVFRLTEGIRKLGEGRPGLPLAVERADELGRVAEAFNEMAEQLEEARLRVVAETERTLDLERQIRQAETLAVAGKLAASVAHEVGTPLNVISGRAEFLSQALPAGDPHRKDLEVIIAQIDRISGIIRGLLDMVGPHKPKLQPTALAAVLDRLLPLLQYSARRMGITLTSALPSDLPPVLADANQLQQVLINLLMNALEATPARGRVMIGAAEAARNGRAGVAISVTDTGPGIAAEVLPRVFDPFFTTKPPGQGTGLGLAISRDIVREHDGTIEVESRVGAGATFIVWLPRAEDGAPRHRPCPPGSAGADVSVPGGSEAWR